MKQKDKAKAYDEVLTKAAALYKASEPMSGCNVILETLFPELTESEDEKVRKELIKHLKELSDWKEDEVIPVKNPSYYRQWASWLEKQAEHANFLSKIQVGDKVTRNEDGVLVNLSQLKRVAKPRERQGEKNLADKVEPKFEIGDWVINRTNAIIMQIVNNKDFYESVEIDGQRRTDSYNYADWDFRLWTIQDAKDGDVLIVGDEDGTGIAICGKNDKLGNNILHCYYDDENGFAMNTPIASECLLHPATKEQRELLFKKMKEAGYEWDAEKKELKKIHVIDEGKSEMDYCFTKMMNGEKVTPAWSEKDEPQKELAESYLAKFDEKFPILPTLKGKQLADYKNFLNKCQQIFRLKYWGIRPIQAKLFEKLSLLWAAWGAEHLQGLGQTDGNMDNEK